MYNYCLEVNRKKLNETRLTELGSPLAIELNDQQAVLEVERFALTSNNVTYGLAGDLLGYWNFFPAEEGWGRIPAWGIAKVVRSKGGDLKEGDRYYGYFPMATYLVVDCGECTADGFTDLAAHRQNLSPFYNRYLKMDEQFGFDSKHDNHQMLYRPLFATAFVLQDFLVANNFYGANQIILGSASSKTALGIAFMLKQHNPGVSVIGLTSKGNHSFVESTGLYADVVVYDRLEDKLDASKPYGFVDMSGDQKIINQLRDHLRGNLTLHLGVGASHWSADPTIKPSAFGAEKISFFAPSEIDLRVNKWGEEKFYQRLNASWLAFVAEIDSWIEIDYFDGADRLKTVFGSLLAGAAPNTGIVVRPNG